MGLIDVLMRRKEEQQQKADFSFKTDKDRYILKQTLVFKRSQLLDYFNKFTKLTAGLAGKEVREKWKDIERDEWEVPESQRRMMRNKLLKQMKFNNVIKKVQRDNPDFKVLTKKVRQLKFKRLKDGHKYRATIEIGGICIGEKTE